MEQVDITKYLDNTAPISSYEDLGVLRFAKDFYPEVFSSKFATLHYEAAKVFFELYNPKRLTREDRKGYAVIHREAAKTTLVNFLLPLYIIYTKGYPWYLTFDNRLTEVTNKEKFIIIVSETASSAERFTMNIRSAISRNGYMAAIFGEKSPKELHIDEEVRKGEQVWRKTAFITTDDTIVYGVGVGQQIRGMSINNTRPTLLIADDLYSNKTVKTEQMRQKVNLYIETELSNSLDSPSGKTMFLGTILNRDTHIYQVTRDSDWFGIQKPIISLEELQSIINKLERDEQGCIIVPSVEECKDMEDRCQTLSWRERHSLRFILQLYRRAEKKNDLQIFYQEYLNITKDPDADDFADNKFVFTDFAMVGDMFTFKFAGYDWRCYPDWNVAIDLASSENAKADDSAIVMSAHVQAKTDIPGTNKSEFKTFCITAHVEGGKYDITPTPFNTGKRNYVDAILNIKKIYKRIKNVDIEANGQQATICRTVRDGIRTALQEKKEHISINEVIHSNQMKKEERIRSELKSWLALYGFCLVVDTPEARNMVKQVQYLGETPKDDYADGWGQSTVRCHRRQLYSEPPRPQTKEQKEKKQRDFDWRVV